MRSILALVAAILVIGTLALLNGPALVSRWAPPRELPGLEMVDIDPGAYELTILVANSQGRKYLSKPVELADPFQISRYEITIDQWNICFEDGGCAHRARQRTYQDGSHPVTRVSWLDAQAFTKWLSRETGQTYRLPTEEEWAYVARSGRDYDQPVIDALIRKRQAAQFVARSLFRKTQQIGTSGMNDWSVYDMNGSVWEWTLTCNFASDEQNITLRTIEQLSDRGLCANRIVQGDERAHVPFFVDEVFSGGCGTGAPVDHIGFRLVKEI